MSFFQSIFDASRCTGPLVAGEPMCTFGDLITFLYALIKFLMLVLAPLATVIAILYGAFLIMLAGANPNFLNKGRAAIYNALWGMVIVLAAWIIVNSVFWLFGFQLSCPWYKITC